MAFCMNKVYYRPFRSGVSVVILSVMSVFSFVWVAGFVELAARSANRMFFFALRKHTHAIYRVF